MAVTSASVLPSIKARILSAMLSARDGLAAMLTTLITSVCIPLVRVCRHLISQLIHQRGGQFAALVKPVNTACQIVIARCLGVQLLLLVFQTCDTVRGPGNFGLIIGFHGKVFLACENTFYQVFIQAFQKSPVCVYALP